MTRHEPDARAIARSVIARSGRRIPRDLLPEIEELLTDAAHDGLEFGEGFANAMRTKAPSGLEHYTQGYLDAINDFELEQGEE